MQMAKAETTKLAHSTATVVASDEQLGATLAAYHIQAAAALARQAKREESDNTAHAFEKVFNPIFWTVSASVLLAWAALEANINHLVRSLKIRMLGILGELNVVPFCMANK